MGKVYASSDWHAQLNLGIKVLEYLQPDDKLYYLGDSTDRGTCGIELLELLLNDKRVIYIKGNHDQFIIEENEYLWYLNGGLKTEKAIKNLSKQKKEELKNKLRALPEIVRIKNAAGADIILCHAGVNPWQSEVELIRMGTKDPYLWDRTHISSDWSSKPEFKNTYVVHGHTPTVVHHNLIKHMEPPMPGDEQLPLLDSPRISRYCRGHKICIDLGSFYSKRTCLFNLDTFEAIYFEDK